MLDSYIIDFFKKEERKQEEAGVPLYIHPPGFDEYRDNPYVPNDANKNNKRYIEVDYEVDVDKYGIIIEM
jgi:hypothetical protein